MYFPFRIFVFSSDIIIIKIIIITAAAAAATIIAADCQTGFLSRHFLTRDSFGPRRG